MVGREKLPDWSRLWDDVTQEGIREGSQSRDQEKAKGGADEQNVALVGKRKDKKKDMSKVKSFTYHKTGHYASQCPNKKKRKKEPEVSTSVEVVEFTEKFEKEFSLMI